MRRRACFVVPVWLLLIRAPGAEAQLVGAPDATWQSIREAIVKRNGALIVRRAGVDVARALVAVAGSPATVELTAEVEEGGGSVRTELTRELWSGGRRAALRGVAEREADRASVELDTELRKVLLRADQLLLQAAFRAAIAERLAAQDSLLADAEDALRARFAVGTARFSELLRLRVERLRVQSDRAGAVSAARGRRLALLALAMATDGDPFAAAMDSVIGRMAADTTQGLLPPPSRDSLLSLSSAVRLATADVATAQAGHRLATAGRRPALTGGLGLQRFDTPGRFTPTVSAALTLPFTSAGPGRALRAADAEVARAEASARNAVGTTEARMSEAATVYDSARERLLIYDAALLRGAREEREAALATFRAGEVTLVELLDFELALARAEIGRWETRIAATDALATLLSGGEGEDQ